MWLWIHRLLPLLLLLLLAATPLCIMFLMLVKQRHGLADVPVMVSLKTCCHISNSKERKAIFKVPYYAPLALMATLPQSEPCVPTPCQTCGRSIQVWTEGCAGVLLSGRTFKRSRLSELRVRECRVLSGADRVGPAWTRLCCSDSLLNAQLQPCRYQMHICGSPKGLLLMSIRRQRCQKGPANSWTNRCFVEE